MFPATASSIVHRDTSKSFLVLFLVFLPFLGVYRILEFCGENYQQEEAFRLREELQEIVGHFAKLATPKFYFQEFFERLAKSFKYGEPERILQNQPFDCFRIYLFSKEGKRIKYPGFSNDMIFVSEQCFSFLRNFARDPSFSLSPTEKKKAEAFFGTSGILPVMSFFPGRILSIRDGLSRFFDAG